MALHDIAYTMGIEGGSGQSMSPPSGKIWKVYGFYSNQSSVTINGSEYINGHPNYEPNDYETQGIYLDSDDTLSVNGSDVYANLYAQEVGNSETSTPIETQWYSFSLSADQRQAVTVPTGTWKIFTRGTFNVRVQVQTDIGNTSYTTIKANGSNNAPHVNGGQTVYVYNAGSSSYNYSLGLLRIA